MTGLLRPFGKVEKLQIDPCLIWDVTVALGSNDVARSREILPELCELTLAGLCALPGDV